MHVCFVCSGNICRSPMAAVVFTEHLRREGLADKVLVTSAGIGPWHVGEPADPRALRTLRDNAYAPEHVAAQVGAEHLSADLLLAMDSGHEAALRDLLTHQGDDPNRVRMFRSFDPDATGDLDVPDPYYGHGDGFVEVLGMVEAAMPGLLAWVRERL
ncbi:low molecular weight protein-tyrosine-phosphatase [Actinophytocola gossypii]|uniref:protein-tyrosine-phosphatase n=1 Tax=Actinophytocola gossypii TaxID=2812003 RepID=A0ABT2JHK1_9PSEU|nr:low molecular weight protein-tyrosine-phosphatase [Actinophytocola gossypii]MCT2587354.1 low molecular weight phosphotyrosine protein phosphatase [Actinophytocola gossypii]